MTQNKIALKILNMGKDGYKNDAEGFEKLNQANALIENQVTEQLILSGVVGRSEQLDCDLCDGTGLNDRYTVPEDCHLCQGSGEAN